MTQKLPPLNPLRTFEAVARLRNLTQAARELHVGQSAVSKQLRVLEEYLGVKLYRRAQRGINLTEEGHAFAAQIIPAFEQITTATRNITEHVHDNIIRIQTYTTVAGKWLIPRLEDFHQRYPKLNVVIINSVKEVDFEKDQVDFSIQLGRGSWEGAEIDFLFEDVIEPVCSPNFLKQHVSNLNYPQAVLRTRLLLSSFRPRKDWRLWARLTRHEEEIENTAPMSFSSSLLAWQAARDNLGVAMGQLPLLVEDFENKLLVAPFQLPVKTGFSFYLLRPKFQRETNKIMLFRDWLLQQAASTQAEYPYSKAN